MDRGYPTPSRGYGSGVLRFPFKGFVVLKPKAGQSYETQRVPIDGVPNLGYAWQLNDLYCPIALYTNAQGEKAPPPVPNFSLELNVISASQIVFSVKIDPVLVFQKPEIVFNYCGLGGAARSAPPNPLRVESSTQLQCSLSFTSDQTLLYAIMYIGATNQGENAANAPNPGFINYYFL